MITEALFIGLVIGFLFYELVGISPGGVIAPGYIALSIHQPQKILITVLLAVIVWGLITVLSKHLIIYGRRKLLLCLVFGFSLKLVLEIWILPLPEIPFDLRSIGYIIPGLVANEMLKQQVVPTLFAISIVASCVYLVLVMFTFPPF